MPPAPGYLGIDVGTSGCKAVVIDARGRAAATVWAAYPTRRRLDGEVTQDAGDWLRAVRRAMAASSRAVRGRLDIAGISVTAPAHVAVLVGSDGEPLARCLLAFDGRAGPMAHTLRARYGPKFFERTFVELSSAWTFPQLAWLREQAPALWGRIRYVLTQKDYIRFRLTGAAAVDPSDAAGTAMFDARAGRWLDDVRIELGLAREALPEVRAATSIAGGLGPGWARQTGLAAGTPVAIGATDTAAELVSVGARDRGASLVKVASTGTVVVVAEEPVPDRRVLTYPHAIPDRWYMLAATNTAATAYGWLRETVFGSAAEPPASVYREMDRLASRVPPGAGRLLFLPFLEGERTPFWDRDLRAAFVGLSSAHTRSHLCRAVLEGVAFSLRWCTETIESLGLPVDRPVLGGGGMSSRLWRRILVAALARPALTVEPQGPAVGAALLAALAVGDDSVPTSPRRSAVVEPEAAWRADYDDLYGTYRLAARAIEPVSHALTRAVIDGDRGGQD